MLKEVKKDTQNYALELLSIICPFIAGAKASKEYFSNLSNHILLEKIKTFIENQDGDFDEWLKLAFDFQKDSSKYEETVKILIYTIDSFNDDKKIHIYANLMRAYKCKLINQDLFLRLSSILPVLFFNDIIFLKDNIKKEIIEDIDENKFLPLEASNLFNHHLMYCVNKDTWGAVGGHRVYCITNLGLEMVRCGVDYENYDTYKEINPEALAKISMENFRKFAKSITNRKD